MRTMTIFVLMAAAVLQAADSADALFRRGVQAYERGEYAEAVRSFEEAADRGRASAALYYNLGNAYYKQDDIGRAVLNYERARRLAPRDEDIRFNLGVAQLRVVDKIASPEIDPIYKFFLGIKTLLTLPQLTRLTILLYLLFMALLIVRQWDRGNRLSFLRYAVRPILILLIVIGALFALRVHEDMTTVEAVVLQKSVTVLSEPQAAATEVFTLHEGVKVRIIDQSGAYVRLRLADGKDGWAPAGALEII